MSVLPAVLSEYAYVIVNTETHDKLPAGIYMLKLQTSSTRPALLYGGKCRVPKTKN
jgi:hypothetical protein